MRILGIESSCDDTAVAVVEDGKKVISSVVINQNNIHEIYGGVVPEIAARQHLLAINKAFEDATSSINIAEIDAVAVTNGPGLSGSLLIGQSFAQGFCLANNLPLIPLNHIHAHMHGAFLDLDLDSVFPCLGLVVSGGHTNLFYMQGPLHFKLIAESKDDACGECFDKVAKLLGLTYPGGPKIELLADGGNPKAYPMPHILGGDALEFSYSGLKTHVAYFLSKNNLDTEQKRKDFAASFQQAAFEQILRKLKRAEELYSDIRSIVIAGGVAANTEFRLSAPRYLSKKVHFAPLKYCSDNAAMVAAYGFHLFNNNKEKYLTDFIPEIFSSYENDPNL